MDVSFNFLLQATRVLHLGNYTSDELDMIYKYITKLDEETLNDFKENSNFLGYENDLELYFEITDALIKIYEEKEEYEKCDILLNKKETINKNKNI